MEKVSIITHRDDPLPFMVADTRLARTTWRQDGLWLGVSDGGLYSGVHRASTLAAANLLHAKNSGLLRGLDAAFVSDVPAEAGF